MNENVIKAALLGFGTVGTGVYKVLKNQEKEMSAKIGCKVEIKTDYINRLKVGLSNMVRNSGFENMNEFLLTFRECRNAYTDYQRQYESWKNACRKPDTPTHKDEKLSDKLARLQREAAENQNSISRQTKDRGGR